MPHCNKSFPKLVFLFCLNYPLSYSISLSFSTFGHLSSFTFVPFTEFPVSVLSCLQVFVTSWLLVVYQASDPLHTLTFPVPFCYDSTLLSLLDPDPLTTLTSRNCIIFIKIPYITGLLSLLSSSWT